MGICMHIPLIAIGVVASLVEGVSLVWHFGLAIVTECMTFHAHRHYTTLAIYVWTVSIAFVISFYKVSYLILTLIKYQM